MTAIAGTVAGFRKLGNKCQCARCSCVFRSLSTFDKHRVGPWADRRCLTHQEMQDRGFRQRADGVWMGKANPLWAEAA